MKPRTSRFSFCHPAEALLLAAGILAAGLRPVRAVEVTVKNDSVTDLAGAAVQVGFVAGERGAAWLTAPCTGPIVAVQVLWRSASPTGGLSLEDSITIYNGGTFPVPGPPLVVIEGPVMTDGPINEFRFLDENMTNPLNVPVTSGQVFVVSFQFQNTPPGSGPSLVTDVDGCQGGKNGIFAIPPSIWFNACALGVSGDFVIRAVIDCPGTQACCFLPSGCLNLNAVNCAAAGGFSQGSGTSCATTTCFPTGACCNPDGTCDDAVLDDDCTASGGTFQGDGVLCSGVSCPQPPGACCLSNGNCLELSDADCNVIPNSRWAGFGTDCIDADMNMLADDCEVTGCGSCQLYTDLEPFYCVIDIGDLLTVLTSYEEVDPCSTPSSVGNTPGSLVYDAGCPVPCPNGPADCTGGLGQECVNGLCCDLCDISEILQVLDMFADPTTPNCPHACPPGACDLPSPDNCCRDGSYFTGVGQNQGTTETDCFIAGGTYLGHNTTCAASALPMCP